MTPPTRPSPEHTPAQPARLVLPVDACAHEIGAAIRSHPVIIVRGETGSGKTTRIPQICLAIGRGTGGLIGCTQPRRVAAVTVAERVAQELGAHGGCVGWQHRFSRRLSRDTTIKFMTDGILLAEIRDDPFLRRYDTIMVDEAHERTLNIDLILGCLKRLLQRRRDLRVIVSSATLETGRFADFFENAPVIDIPGRTFPVEVRYRDPGEEADLAQAVADAVEEALLEPDPGDLLVFLPGERDIRNAADTLSGRALPHTAVIPLMASLPPGEQKRAFQPLPGIHRIILSTNVAETSVTLPGIRTVIDSGLARINRLDPRARITRLQIEPVSRASADQRKGRCGRIGPGVCIRLYTEEDYNKRPAYTDPEIRRSSLAGLILSMFDWKLGDLADFPFVQPPAHAIIREGYKELLELGAIREAPPRPDGSLPRHHHAITPLGRQIVRLPLDPRLGRMLLAAEEQHVMHDALTVVAGLACEDPLLRPADRVEAASRAHAAFKNDQSDFAGMLRLWRFFHEQGVPSSRSALRRKCTEHFVSFRKLCEWEDVRTQLERLLKTMGVVTDTRDGGDVNLHKALLTGLLANVAQWDPEARNYRGANGVRVIIFPGSGLARKTPAWIVSAEHVQTSQLFARRVAAIDPVWIEPLARHVCKYHYHSEYWDDHIGTGRALRRVTLNGLLISDGVRSDISRFNPEFCRDLFIREGLIEGRFPKPVPAFVTHNLDWMGKRLAARHKTRSADPDADKQEAAALYAARLPPDCVNVPSLRAWLANAAAADQDALRFRETDFADAPDAAAGFPDHVVLADRRLPLRYRHAPQADDDGITCTLTIPDIPLLRFWHADWLVPGARHDKVVVLLRQLTRATLAHIATALEAGTGRDLDAIADACLARMRPHQPLAQSLAWMLMHETGTAVDPAPWNEACLPPAQVMRWRVVDADHKAVFVSRDPAEIADFYDELRRIAPDIAPPESPRRYGAQGLVETSGMRTPDFPDLPESILIGHAGSPILAFPALVDETHSVGIRLFSTASAAQKAHEQGVLRLVAIAGRFAPPPFRPPRASLLPQPNLPADVFVGALRDTFIVGVNPLPRTAHTLATHIAARSSQYGDTIRERTQRVRAILEQAEACLGLLDNARNLPVASSEDVAEQIGWLVFPGFAAEVPLTQLRDYPRYLQAVERRIERDNRDPAKALQRFDRVAPYWRRFTDFTARLAHQPPYNPVALEAYRWLVEEWRVSVWAQELRTAMPVSIPRLDHGWSAVVKP